MHLFVTNTHTLIYTNPYTYTHTLAFINLFIISVIDPNTQNNLISFPNSILVNTYNITQIHGEQHLERIVEYKDISEFVRRSVLHVSWSHFQYKKQI